MTNQYWTLLGIDPTTDKRAIKRAYSVALKSHHPEDDPQGFQALNEAYRWALDYADYDHEDMDYESIDESVDEPIGEPVDKSIEESTEQIADEVALAVDVEEALPSSPSQEATVEATPIDPQILAIRQFIERFTDTIETPLKRKDLSTWSALLHELESASFSFKEQVFFPIFDSFIAHYRDQSVAETNAFIPKGITAKFAQHLDWKANELTLIKYYEREDVSLVMLRAFGHAESNIENEEFTGWKKYRGLLANITLGFGLMVLLTLGFSYLLDNRENKTDQQEEVVVDKTAWNEVLTPCLSLDNPDTVDAVESCESLAEEGWLKAQYALAWHFSRDSESKDWQKTFDYLKLASWYDMHAELLSQIILYRLGTDEEDVSRGEKGIKALANNGFAPAQAFQAVMYFRKDHEQKATASPVYLLETAYKSGMSLVNEFEMASFYINGFSNRSQPYQRALKVLQDSAENDYPTGTNNVAWFLATLDENPLTEPTYAVELASDVVNDPQYAETIAFIDTLAAAHATAGNFDEAVKLQTKAIELIKQSDIDEENKQSQVEDFTARLSEFEAGRKVIFYELNIEKEAFFDELNSQLGNRLFLRLNQLAQPDS